MEAEDTDELTKLERPPPLTTASKTVATPEQALAGVEATRVRGLMSSMTGSSVVTMLIVLVVTGDRDAQMFHAAALGGSAALTGGIALWFRNPKRYNERLAMYAILAQLVVLVSGFYFWGVFSAYGVLVPLTVYIAAGTTHRTEFVIGVALLVIAQGGIGLATVLDWIPSRGLVETTTRADLRTELVALGLVQVITIGAAIAGRIARRESVKALEQHNQALLELALREAQLAEAYADARAAREAGLGGVGRFTDQTIDGFRLGAVLGRGAMGEVYAARRTDESDATLAIKLLAPHLLRDNAARERFMRESAIVSKLSSPHVVRVIAVSPADAVLPYIVMEKLVGIDLAQLIKREAVPPLADVSKLVHHVSQGLDAAHKAGIIHRDLKPSNLYATGEGDARIWKVLDFGASKWRDSDGTLTQDAIVGTPGYMSPEQALGRAIDQRSDVYAFGVIIYRLVTGVPAVVPGEVPAMLQEVAYRMPVQPSKRATVSPAIEAVLAVALAKSPVHRFATAGELARAFEDAIAGKLDRAITRRAQAVLEETPWGTWAK